MMPVQDIQEETPDPAQEVRDRWPRKSVIKDVTAGEHYIAVLLKADVNPSKAQVAALEGLLENVALIQTAEVTHRFTAPADFSGYQAQIILQGIFRRVAQ